VLHVIGHLPGAKSGKKTGMKCVIAAKSAEDENRNLGVKKNSRSFWKAATT
jgi:hypothetical protein